MTTGTEYDELFESIKMRGVLDPIIARYTNETNESGNDIYEIISGHTRIDIAKKFGIEKIPAIIKSVDDDIADIMVVECNYGRKNMYPSDLGKAFKLRLDAMNRQGKRADSTSVHSEQKSSRDELASMFGISGSKVHRYMRLTYLISEFKEDVDNKDISLSIAENISYLQTVEQQTLHQLLTKNTLGLTHPQSIMLKKESITASKGEPPSILTKERILDILQSEAHKKQINKKKPLNDKAFMDSISNHIRFKDKQLSPEDMLDLIMKALDSYEEE
jgi:ParB family chromosome partitioning protein